MLIEKLPWHDPISEQQYYNRRSNKPRTERFTLYNGRFSKVCNNVWNLHTLKPLTTIDLRI